MSWEYKSLMVKAKGGILRETKPETDLDEVCNEAGREGWELVSAFSIAETQGRTSSICLLFKRPR
ncbi:MAG: DUF4177 domain-containing protein [candidate division Zixibacteria bacterium]|nr:DUF4177 domain-containing protein [candidate division Zixibacteria bacterium]